MTNSSLTLPPDLENKILGLVTNENWGQVADLFLQIPMKNYCELNKFMLKLFEIVTEEYHGDSTFLAENTFPLFLKEIKSKTSKKEFLPIQKEILSQFAASLILHLPAENALSVVIECYETYQLEPCFYHSYYNPEAESEAIKARQEPIQVCTISESSFLTLSSG